MGLFDFIKGEVIDVIEWTSNSRATLAYRFPTHQHAIKMGAQLTVREGQAAVFINEGALADVFTPGRYELETSNLPIMTKLQSWKHGFTSPFKAEVIFVSTVQTTDRKWGTQNPIMMRDPEIGPVRLRAFGSYGFRVSDPGKFIQEVVGTDGHFTVDEIDKQLRSQVVSSFTDALGEAKVPVLDLASQYRELGETMRTVMKEDFSGYGLELTAFIIENISLPPEVEKMLDKRASMGILGDMGKYTQFQAAQAMEAAASSPGGSAGSAMGMGAGLAMGQAMMSAMTSATAAPAAPAAPVAPAAPAAPSADDLVARLGKLKTLLDAGLISQDDFDAKKGEILASI
jgi:membrane protease subunit (stomatin/prohibitin family)